MLRRESVSGSLGGVAAPGGRAVGSENRAHRPLVPPGAMPDGYLKTQGLPRCWRSSGMKRAELLVR